MAVLSWQELEEKDQPPERIWLDSEALSAHFEDVRVRRSSGAGTDDTEAVPMWENQDPDVANEIRRLKRGR